MMRIDRKYQTYKSYTLVGPTVTRQVQDPLTVLRLKNRLSIHFTLAEFLIADNHQSYFDAQN